MLRKATCAIAVAAALAACAASAAPKDGTYTQKVMGLIAPFTVNVPIENGRIDKSGSRLRIISSAELPQNPPYGSRSGLMMN